MDGGEIPAVQSGDVAVVLHTGKVPLGDGDGRRFDLAGPYGPYAVPGRGKGEYSYAVKETAQGQRGVAHGRSPLARRGGHQAVKAAVLGHDVGEGHQRPAHAKQAVARFGVLHIAHLGVGQV